MAKSIVAIDVDDSKFKAFAAAFAKYQDALKGMPKDWQQANAASGQHADNVEKALKKIQKAQKDLNKDIADGNQQLKNTAKITGEIASNFASSAISIAKWLTLSAIGGGFGLGALAGATSNVRKTASGLGVTSGELRAANINYSQVLNNPEAALSKIADAQNDLKSQMVLQRLGGLPGQDAAQMLPTVFKNAIKEWGSSPLGQTVQSAHALGLDLLFDIQDLRRGLTNKDKLGGIESRFNEDVKTFTLPGGDEEAMSRFWMQLKRSGESLEINLIKALAPLAEPLGKLSEAVTKAIGDFSNSKEVQKALKDFTQYLNSEEAKKDIKAFFDGIETMGKVMLKIGDTFGIVGRGIGNAAGYLASGSPSAKHAHEYMQELEQEEKETNATKSKSGKINVIDYTKKLIDTISSGSLPSERNNNPGNLRSWNGLSGSDGFEYR